MYRASGYYARYVAKSLVAAGLASRVIVQVSYVAGSADPMSVYVDSMGTCNNNLTDEDLLAIVKKNFSFRLPLMIRELNLKRPIYKKTARYGHFGRSDGDFTWEKPKKDFKIA